MDGRRAGLPLGPQADGYLHVTTGKQARAAAMRAVRKVQSIPESDLADRCYLNECVCMFWCASRIPKTATAVSKGGALAESSQGGVPGAQTSVRLGQGARQVRMIKTMGIIRRRTK